MKKSVSGFKSLLLILCLAFAAPFVKAQDSNPIVDAICNTFDDMTKQVLACQSLGDFDSIDMDGALLRSGFDPTGDYDQNYVLTAGDKSRIVKTYDNFSDTLASQMVKLSGGMIPLEMIRAQIDPMKADFKKGVDSSKTIGDLVEMMSNFQ